MKIKETGWAMGYSVFQVAQGLVMHPYPTVRRVVRERVFLFMLGSPVVAWLVALAVWRAVSWTLFAVVPYPNFWVFLALWFTVGIGMYQVLLVYLWVRFWRAGVA